MADDKLNYLQDGAINNLSWINYVLIAGVILAGTIILLKLTGHTSFKWLDIDFDTRYAWIICILFTLGHWYTAWLFIRSVVDLWKKGTSEECLTAFNKIVTSGGLFVRGLIPRVTSVDGIYQMSWKDPTTLVSHLGALIIILAIVPFDFTGAILIRPYIGVAIILMIINWIIGSNWAVALSQLSVERDRALVLKKLAGKMGTTISHS
jgi:hypothetical protein